MLKKSFVALFKKFDRNLDLELPFLVILLVLVVLRIPNFFEPYWYGDEAIYLTIGHALREGSLLYAQIVDHKTPLIYYLAMVPNQFWFRVLLFVFMTITSFAFYNLALRVFKKIWPAFLSTLFLVVMTSLPWFEGNIPNGELFVAGFVMVGALLISYTKFFADFIEEKELSVSKKQPFQAGVAMALAKTHDSWLYLIGGAFFGLAILTKVPALFDLAGFLLIAWFGLVANLMIKRFSPRALLANFGYLLPQVGLIMIGAVLPIVVSIIYFWLRGTLGAYLDFGLLYNFRYVGTWVLKFDSPILGWLYTFPGKLAVTTVIILALTGLRRFLSPVTLLSAGWFALALFASLLSNRPYPHYFIQVMPPLALMLGSLLAELQGVFEPRVARLKLVRVGLTTGVVVGLVALFIGVLTTLNVGLYPTKSYYLRTYYYLTGQIDRHTFYQRFNHLMSDNYQAAAIIRKSDDPQLFIWGTNPGLYALSQKVPVGRFTVGFHIKDLGLYQETIEAVRRERPKFIVVMRNEDTVLEGLSEFLSEDYILNENFHYFELWKKVGQ